MSDKKIRYYITPSSLGSYFGVGFNSPEEQFRIDTGQDKSYFDDESMLRMELGNYLEESATDYFQDIIFKVPITDRNEEVKWGLDNRVKYKLDGIIHFKDKKAVFENKISNSNSTKFTEDLTYMFQIQTYMMCEELDTAVIAGLYHGKPIYRIYERNEDMVIDIKEMINFVINALEGMVDFYEDFPVHLLEKYSPNKKIYEPVTELPRMTVEYIHKLADLQKQVKALNDEIKMLNTMHNNNVGIEEGSYEDDYLTMNVSNVVRRGGFDVDKFITDFPFLDLEDYFKPDTQYQVKRLKIKEPM